MEPRRGGGRKVTPFSELPKPCGSPLGAFLTVFPRDRLVPLLLAAETELVGDVFHVGEGPIR